MIALSRIILYSKDVDGLKNFYQEHFNFSLGEEIKNEWVVLKAGQTELAFHRIGEAYRDIRKSFHTESNTKLVFKIESDLHEFRARLMESKVVMQDVKSYTGFNCLLCDGKDPEGNVFQLMKVIE